MQSAKETALEAYAVAQMQESISQRGAMLVYAAEYSNVKVLRLMRRVVFKCWCAFVKYGGSASCVAIVLQSTASLARALFGGLLSEIVKTDGAVATGICRRCCRHRACVLRGGPHVRPCALRWQGGGAQTSDDGAPTFITVGARWRLRQMDRVH
jgi:hypothetical protein